MKRSPSTAALCALAIVTFCACSPATLQSTDSGSGTPGAAQGITLAVQPTSTQIAPGASAAFTATAYGTASPRFTWQVQEAGGGTIDDSGHYTAPQTPGSYHVRASVVDSSSSAVATVTVTAGATSSNPSGPSPSPSPTPAGLVAAFPGAQGGGAGAVGGRGGTVYRVTNLNDSGSGSLRACVEASGPRTCVFAVGGTISLARELTISDGYITVAGQTAPGGIAVSYGGHGGSQNVFNIVPPAHDVVIRFVRMWGDWVNCVQPGGSYVGTRGVSMWGGVHDVIVDHCEMLWHSAAAFGLWADQGTSDQNGRVTVSWSLMGEAVMNHTCTIAGQASDPQSTVLLSADQNYDPSTLVDVDLHHNLLVSGDHRMPCLNGSGRFVNNVVYNFSRALDIESGGNPGGAESTYDVIGNAWRLGPWSASPSNREIQANWGTAGIYTANNVSDWHAATGSDTDGGWSLLTDYSGSYQGPEAGQPAPGSFKRSPWARLPTPASGIDITPDDASTVLATLSAAGGVGASWQLTCDGTWVSISDDARDRILSYVTAREGPTVPPSSAAGANGGALPALTSGPSCADSNTNGIPDAYEIARCGSATCMNANAVQSDGYTNLEHYLAGQ